MFELLAALTIGSGLVAAWAFARASYYGGRIDQIRQGDGSRKGYH